MTSLPASSSEKIPFDLLRPEVQQWVWNQGWPSLRDIQSKAIGAILSGDRDLILAATTAAGKTEAAFLPILSRIATQPSKSFSVFYISPLKALINDQFRRLEDLCKALDLPVVKWHGDASAAAKAKAEARPRGVVLITPESLESLLVRRGPAVRPMIEELQFVVIDELHAFLSGERGVHLASLLKRLEAQGGRRFRKIGLSATIGDFAAAKTYLNPYDPNTVELIEGSTGDRELQLQIRGYFEPETLTDAHPTSALTAIVDHLFKVLRGTNNLIFAPSRKLVETIADGLLRNSTDKTVPNEFFPHHGSLAKNLREDLEDRLKATELPTTAVATTTLELGIDIGSVHSIAQIGPPASVSALRQRLGRSGRRKGAPSILRLYVEEPLEPAGDNAFDRLRLDIIQAIAAVELLRVHWVEPGSEEGVHLSTLLHQTLAVICEQGGKHPRALYDLLCGPGPFALVSKTDYANLLKAMAVTSPALITQERDGTLMLGPLGETLTGRFDFYAVFSSDEEYRIVTEQRTLGTVPISNTLREGDYIIFAGRRWIVRGVDDRAKVVTVMDAPVGRVPKFTSDEGPPLHDVLVAKMCDIYETDESYGFLDPIAALLLAEGRSAYRDMRLHERQLLNIGDTTFYFLWRGTKATETLKLALATRGIASKTYTAGVVAERCAPAAFERALSDLAAHPPTALELAALAQPLRRQKYDSYLPDALMIDAFARSRVDTEFLRSLTHAPLALPGAAREQEPATGSGGS